MKLIAFEDVISLMTSQYLTFITSDFSNVYLDNEIFAKFKKKAIKRILKLLIEEKNSVKIEKEIFNKIIKYNYTNNFDLIEKVQIINFLNSN